jgi:hypothetical protein
MPNFHTRSKEGRKSNLGVGEKRTVKVTATEIRFLYSGFGVELTDTRFPFWQVMEGSKSLPQCGGI